MELVLLRQLLGISCSGASSELQCMILVLVALVGAGITAWLQLASTAACSGCAAYVHLGCVQGLITTTDHKCNINVPMLVKALKGMIQACSSVTTSGGTGIDYL
jgi:hypothetical protein